MMTVRKATFTSATLGALPSLSTLTLTSACTPTAQCATPHKQKSEGMPVFTDVVIFPLSAEKVVLPDKEQKEDGKATKNMIK